MARKIEAYGNVMGTDSVRKTTEGSTTVKTGAGNLDTVVVGKTGDLCTLTLKDDATTIYEGQLNDQYTRMGRVGKAYTLDFASLPFDTSLKVELHVPAATSHFKLDSITGSDAYDTGSLLDDADCTNMANDDWVAGRINNGLVFDGVDDYIDCGNVNAFELDDPFSISLWFKYNANGTQYIYSKRVAGTEAGYGCIIKPDDYIEFHIIGTGGAIVHKTVNTLTEDTWTLLTITCDGSETAEGVKIYQNAVRRETLVTYDGLSGTVASTQQLDIGRFRTGNYFSGTMDDFRIYTEELTPDEIMLIYNSGQGTHDDFSLGEVSITYN